MSAPEQPIHPATNPGWDVDHDYEPDSDAELVLNIMKTDVYPSASPSHIAGRTGDEDFSKHDASFALRDLVDAGWVVKRSRGFYDLVIDPRDDVPSWPVRWANRATLPLPLPDESPDEAVAGAVHDIYWRGSRAGIADSDDD